MPDIKREDVEKLRDEIAESLERDWKCLCNGRSKNESEIIGMVVSARSLTEVIKRLTTLLESNP
jgi:hypothetical protein